LQHKMIPPSINFEGPNPKIDFPNTPFYVNTKVTDWNTGEEPRRAGVSSFGIGGTNAHVVLEQAPVVECSGPSRSMRLLILSARTASALEQQTRRLAAHLKEKADLNLADVAYTLQLGRVTFAHKRFVVCSDSREAVAELEATDSLRVFTGVSDARERPVTF